MSYLEDVINRADRCNSTSMAFGAAPRVLIEEDVPTLVRIITRLKKELELIGGMCGNPSAKEGCFIINRHVKTLLKELQSEEPFKNNKFGDVDA